VGELKAAMETQGTGRWQECLEHLLIKAIGKEQRSTREAMWQGHRARDFQDHWHSHCNTESSQYQTWSYRIQCLQYWILVLLWSDPYLLISSSSFRNENAYSFYLGSILHFFL
jgi:hypothetical protein